MGIFSKGESSAQTTQTASNQQVAAQSGIALGVGAQGNEINVSSSDPEVAKYAIQGNVVAEGQALGFAGHAADVAATASQEATHAIESVAGTSILSSNDLATKFGDNTAKLAADQVNLLGSVAQEATTIALGNQATTNAALQGAFGVAAQAAPQTDNYTATALSQTASKTYLYIAAAVVAVFGIIILSRKKA